MQKLLILYLLGLLMVFASCGEEVIENGIYGTVKDAATDEPIAGATITTEPLTQTPSTTESGVFRITDVAPGVYKVTVTATGYRPQTREVHVKDKLVEENFRLEKQELIVTPTALVFAPNRTTLSLTIGRKGNRTLTWEIDQTFEQWLEVSPLKGEVGSISNSVTVKLLRDRLPSATDELTTEIVVRSNGGDVSVSVTVQTTTNGAKAKLLPQRVGVVFVGDKPFATPEQIALENSIGRAYVTNRKANVVSVINIWTDSVIEAIPINQAAGAVLKWARGIFANPNQHEVYVTNFWSGTVSVINSLEGKESDSIPVGDTPVALTTSEDGMTLYVTRTPKDGGEVAVVDLGARKVIKTIQLGGELSGIARKERFLYVANSLKNTIDVIDTQNHELRNPIPVGANPTAVVVSLKRDFVYVANSGDGTVSIIDTVAQSVIGTIPVGHKPSGLAVDSGYDDGDVVYVTNSQDRSISVIDVATGKVIGAPITVGTSPIGISVLDGGNKIYVVNSGSNDVSILTNVP